MLIYFVKHFPTMNKSYIFSTIDSIHTLVNELNFDLVGLAEIKKQTPYFTIVFHGEVTVMELLHAIYQSSNVLHCLKFLILNEENHSLTSFIEEQYLTKSSAYRIREDPEILQAIGLSLKGNQIVGEEYRIRFLIALLHYKFGIDCYELSDNDLPILQENLSASQTVQSIRLIRK